MPLCKGADRGLSLTCLRAAQLFLFFIWSAKAEIFACKLWRAWIQLLSTHFTHTDIRMDGCQFCVLAGVQTHWLLSLLGFGVHDLKKKKRKKKSPNMKQKTLHKHFWDATGLIFPPLLFCKISLWKQTPARSTLCQDKQQGSFDFISKAIIQQTLDLS